MDELFDVFAWLAYDLAGDQSLADTDRNYWADFCQGLDGDRSNEYRWLDLMTNDERSKLRAKLGDISPEYWRAWHALRAASRSIAALN